MQTTGKLAICFQTCSSAAKLNLKQLLTMDTLARCSRKNAANCDNSGELQLARILETLNANCAPISVGARLFERQQ